MKNITIAGEIAREEVAAMEAAETEALGAYREARARANDARRKLATQTLQAAGIEIGVTPCLAPKWGISMDKEVRVIVEAAGIDGDAFCRPITKKNNPHAGRGAFFCNLAQIKAEVSA